MDCSELHQHVYMLVDGLFNEYIFLSRYKRKAEQEYRQIELGGGCSYIKWRGDWAINTKL